MRLNFSPPKDQGRGDDEEAEISVCWFRFFSSAKVISILAFNGKKKCS